MELTIKDASGKEIGKQKLPVQFEEDIRLDIVKRAVHAIECNQRQRYGADPRAGLRASADVSRRRRKYRGSYGHGISRVPRKVLSRRGTRMNWVGAEAPGTVSGRRAHPPKAEKIYNQKINAKERKKAIRSALHASIDRKMVEKRGHFPPKDYPFIINDSFESMKRTKDVIDALTKVGLTEELDRTSGRKIRAGKGKMRNRRYKSKTGVLVVVSKSCELSIAGRNVPGVDVITIKRLNAKYLAPGSDPGRLTLFTNGAVEIMEKEKLFM